LGSQVTRSQIALLLCLLATRHIDSSMEYTHLGLQE
jgi:hypothetical protein